MHLTDYDIEAESSATPRCGILRFTFPESDTARIQIDLARRVGGTAEREYVEVVDDRTIEGWMHCTPQTGGWGNGDGKVDYTVYFHAELSRAMDSFGVWSADIPDDWVRKRDEVVSEGYLERVAAAPVIEGCRRMEGKHLGFYAEFDTEADEQVTLKVGISFVDMDGARRNFEAEIADKDFDSVAREAYASWNDALGRTRVEGGSDEDKAVFYTALYHSMIDPRLYTDVDGRYVGGDGAVHNAGGEFTKRTIFSGWDVFRSQMPLQTIINPRVVDDLLSSLVTLADQSGREYFERWEIMNAYSGCMFGNPALSVLADAYAKGIRGYDVEKAYRYAVNTSQRFGNGDLGYTPTDQCISYTLEYGYADWCVSRLAAALAGIPQHIRQGEGVVPSAPRRRQLGPVARKCPHYRVVRMCRVQPLSAGMVRAARCRGYGRAYGRPRGGACRSEGVLREDARGYALESILQPCQRTGASGSVPLQPLGRAVDDAEVDADDMPQRLCRPCRGYCGQ